jgi:hypothetical protein
LTKHNFFRKLQPKLIDQIGSRKAIIINCTILVTAMTLFRYVFIFWLKNPAAFEDDFWLIFVNAWSMTFSFLSQLPRALVPGNQGPML